MLHQRPIGVTLIINVIARVLTIKDQDKFCMTEQSVPILSPSWVQDGLLDLWLGSFQLPVDARIDRLPTTEGTLVFISRCLCS
jgi:hypothetical protein